MNYSALAVDQSMTATAWAHLGTDAPISFGSFPLPGWGDDEGKYLWEWFDWLGHKCVDLKVTHLFMEQTFIPAGHDEGLTLRLAQFGLIALGCMVAHKLKIDMQMVTTGQWRPKFIGAEKAPEGLVKHQKRKWLKDKSIAACEKRGWMVQNDNEADACGILCFGVSTIDVNFMVKQGPLWRRAEMSADNEKREMK